MYKLLSLYFLSLSLLIILFGQQNKNTLGVYSIDTIQFELVTNQHKTLKLIPSNPRDTIFVKLNNMDTNEQSFKKTFIGADTLIINSPNFKSGDSYRMLIMINEETVIKKILNIKP